jgi:hypothetical protein
MERNMRTTSTQRSVWSYPGFINGSTESSIWGRPGLIYAGLVTLVIVVSLIARAAGVLPLHEAERPLDHVRGWNPSAAEFSTRQAPDQVDSTRQAPGQVEAVGHRWMR